jgi:putative transposase
MMGAFIDRHRAGYGVEPICAVLPIAPSGYYEHKARERDPARRPARARRDTDLGGHITRVWREHREVYGVRKVWKQLRREGVVVARCTVARLMRRLGLAGALRGWAFRRTTIPDVVATRPPDLGTRQFTATRPNQL